MPTYSGCIFSMFSTSGSSFIRFYFNDTYWKSRYSLLCCLLLSLCLARGASCLPYTHELFAGFLRMWSAPPDKRFSFHCWLGSISRVLLTASVWLSSWWRSREPLLWVSPLVNTRGAVGFREVYRCPNIFKYLCYWPHLVLPFFFLFVCVWVCNGPLCRAA